MLGLLALALLQISIAAHQFQHSTDHGLNVCHVCTAYSEVEHSPHSGTSSAGIPASTYAAPDTAIDLPAVTRLVSAYQSRAPPLS